MRALLQRVRRGSVSIEGKKIAEIGPGMVVLLGVGQGDSETEADSLAHKTAGLRIFADQQGKLNLSLQDCGGEALVISQFTLYADTSHGNRPGFGWAAEPSLAEQLYQRYAASLAEAGVPVQTGVFRAHMLVEIENDGPVTIMLETLAKE
jgi:D-aminoacyl-tRNA deacylase